jgi:D-alanine-D-alanine ligase
LENKFTTFGKVALLSDDFNIANSQEILSVLKNKNIDTNLIIIPKDIKHLIDSTIWHGITRVFLLLSKNNYLSLGYIQGLLDLLNISYTGNGMQVCALANDMVKVKKIWQIMGVATVHFIKLHTQINWQDVIDLLGFPIAVKSIYANVSSTFKATNLEQLKDYCKNFGDINEVMIEPWVTGDPYVVYIVGDQILLPICSEESVTEEIKTQHYDRLDIKKIQKLAKDACLALGGIGPGGLAKINLIKDLNDDFWVESIDLMPLIVRNGLFNKAANNTGISFELLIEKILITSFIKKDHYLKCNLFNKNFNKN